MATTSVPSSVLRLQACASAAVACWFSCDWSELGSVWTSVDVVGAVVGAVVAVVAVVASVCLSGWLI